MKIIGSLDFLGGASVNNLRIERLAADPVSPLDSQLWFNTTDGVYRGRIDGVTVDFATGGDANAIQAELDATQAGAGLNTDGSLAAFTGANYIAASATLRAALVALDAQAKTDADALASEVTARTDADTTLTTNLATEVTNRTNADTALQGDIDDEIARATAAEGVLTTDLATEVQARIDGDAASATALADAVADLETADTANADAIAAEVTRATTAEGTLTTNLASEVTRATTAEGVLTDNLAAEVTARELADLALEQSIDAKLNGLKWKNSVQAIALTNIVLEDAQTIDGVALVAGERVAVAGQTDASENGIYVVAAGAWTRAVDFDGTSPINEINAAAFFVERGTTMGNTSWVQINQVATVDTDPIAFTQTNGAAGITAGAGLRQTGNVVDVGQGDGILVGADAIAVNLAANGGLEFNTGAVQINLDGETLSVTSAGLKVDDGVIANITANTDAIDAEVTRATAAEAALQSDIDDEIARATAAEGTLTTNLAAEVTARQDAITQEVTDRNAAIAAAVSAIEGTTDALQEELDAVETAAGLAADGTLAAFTGANYVAGSTSLREAIVELDSALNAVESNLGSLETKVNAGYFLYTSEASATSHEVPHTLGRQFVSVTVVDSSDQVIIPDSITFDDVNTLTVTFASAINCKVAVVAPKLDV